MFPLAKDGSLLAFPGTPGVATNWHDTPAAGGLTGPRIVEGRAPEADDEVAIDLAEPEQPPLADYRVIGFTRKATSPTPGVTLRSYRCPVRAHGAPRYVRCCEASALVPSVEEDWA